MNDSNDMFVCYLGASSSPSMAGCTDEDKQENRENKTEKKFAVENYFFPSVSFEIKI